MYDFQVGQEIIVVDKRRDIIDKAIVVKKGSKFYHIKYDHYSRLDKLKIGATSIDRDPYTSFEDVYPSIEEYEKSKIRAKREKKIKEVLYRVSLSSVSDEDLAILERIFKIEQEH